MQNVPLEIGVGLVVGLAAGLFVRNYLQNDISVWQDASKPSAIKK